MYNEFSGTALKTQLDVGSELSLLASRGGLHRSSTRAPCNSSSLLLSFLGLRRAGVAQLVEHLICNQRVGGSNPSASSTAKSRPRLTPFSVCGDYSLGSNSAAF